jgi:cell fate regulator YaaT (PSP1 superfamily)
MVVGIKFKKTGQIYNFLSNENLEKNQKVIVETEKGLQLGIVENTNLKVDNKKDLKEIVRIATLEDYETYLNNLSDAKIALTETKEIAKTLDLNMSFIDAFYTLDRKQLLFNFVSDERVDFRELVKELAAKYHTRIELHQMGVRDKSREVGGLGLCGRELCCHGHLRDLCPVNINMVKNQDIALNPTKINGVCGRLLCCFNYENEMYEEMREKMPKVGQKIEKNGKTGIVTKLNILKKKYTVKFDENTFEEVELND